MRIRGTHSNTNSVMAILIYSAKMHFKDISVTLLRQNVKDMTSLLISRHKHYDFNAANLSQ